MNKLEEIIEDNLFMVSEYDYADRDRQVVFISDLKPLEPYIELAEYIVKLSEKKQFDVYLKEYSNKIQSLIQRINNDKN